MELIKHNYLRTYGHGENFYTEIDPPLIKNSNYHALCKTLAENIHENRQGKIFLLYSGGLDSEYILSIFLILGINLIPVIIKLNPNYNDHDVRYAFDFCRSKNLKPVVIDVDFDDFVRSGKIVEISQEFKIGAYQLPSTFSVLEKLDGTIIMGSHGNPHMSYDESNKVWCVDEYEPIHTILKFFENKKLHGCPFFLVHSAEQYLSFLIDVHMRKLANGSFPGKLGNNSTKYLVYNNNNEIRLEKRQKYTGYENIEKSEIFHHPNFEYVKEIGKQWWGIWKIPYHQIIKDLNQ